MPTLSLFAGNACMMEMSMNPLKLYFSRHRTPLHVHVDALTELDYDYITDGIYFGTNQCCTTGLSEVLKKEGIVADVSLEGERIDQPFGVEIYVWLPTPDHYPPTKEQLVFGVSVLEELVAQHKKVYIHCKNGHGRSTTLMSAYLIKHADMTPEKALSFIQTKRPGAHLQNGQKKLLTAYWEQIK